MFLNRISWKVKSGDKEKGEIVIKLCSTEFSPLVFFINFLQFLLVDFIVDWLLVNFQDTILQKNVPYFLSSDLGMVYIILYIITLRKIKKI